MNYLNNDELERYWFQYKAECEPHGISLEKFCNTQKISYRAMDNWRRQIRSKIVPVEVEGMPDKDAQQETKTNQSEGRLSDARFVSCRRRTADLSMEGTVAKDLAKLEEASYSVRIMVNIKTTNGLSIFQKNLDYSGLRLLVERLEGIC